MKHETETIMNEVGKVIIGKDDVIEKVFMAILSKGHVLIEDVPGVGKTTLAIAFSRALGLDYKRVQFTSDSVPSDIIGFSVLQKDAGDLVYKPGAVMTNLLLADEINRTSSKTQSALLEVMEEGNVTVDGVTHAIPEPFIVLATQNPVGSAGTQMLPASQMDRFMICLKMGYPDHDSQINILKDRHTENPLNAVAEVANRDKILALQQAAAAVHVSDIVYDYITRLAEETRAHEMVALGISPRGALALCLMAKSYAVVRGRDFVVPEDVRAVCADVCAHRLVLSPKARMSERDSAGIIREIVDRIELPVM
ncbi:MAG: MoxR family ATPase [Clostridiales Family XIII bacterium]|jgi:MoxR-like ATPase|nr:MoxR family ATPase [Clostridiales Family XIII bacterium]